MLWLVALGGMWGERGKKDERAFGCFVVRQERRLNRLGLGLMRWVWGRRERCRWRIQVGMIEGVCCCCCGDGVFVGLG